MDGASSRSLGNEIGLTGAAVHKKVREEMDALPDNTSLTLECCNRFSGILNIDGKYIAIKGYDKKIPFLYTIDFLTHDIPVGVLAPSENGEAFLKLFRLLKTINYPLRVVICDDTAALKSALFHYYPKAKIQMCHTHYLENIRQMIHVRADTTYRPFFVALVKHVFDEPTTERERNRGLRYVWDTHVKNDPVLQMIVLDVDRRRGELFQYQSIPRCPKTNNMIESSNSHLQGRLKTIKGFQTFRSAARWLNAWMLRRRTKPFTDCEAPFTHLNGKTSLSVTTKKGGTVPSF
jgi:transposase-like protein